MSLFKYLFSVSAKQKKQDWKEYKRLKHGLQNAETLVIVTHANIRYICKQDEFCQRKADKCVTIKHDSVDQVYDPGDYAEFTVEINCPNFKKTTPCQVMGCPCVSNNHKYVDAVLYLEYVEKQKRDFWKNKFKQKNK